VAVKRQTVPVVIAGRGAGDTGGARGDYTAAYPGGL